MFKLDGTIITDRARVDACTMTNLLPFYTYYGSLLTQHNFHETLIFNLDETNINFNQKFRSSSVTRIEDPRAICAQPDRISGLTLVFCMPAEGNPLPATLLWPHPTIPEEFKSFAAKGIRVSCTASAWQTRESFEEMMIKRYIPEMISRRNLLELNDKPILLILDGHLSRLSIPFIECCCQNNIFVLVLPAHSSSVTQPCDCSPFAVLKSVFSKESAIRVNGPRSSPKRTAVASGLSITGSEKASIQQLTQATPERDAYTKTSGGHRRLIAECLPLAVQAASSFATMKEGWRKSALVPFSLDVLRDRVPLGSTYIPPSGRGPNISGKLLTSVETRMSVWRWKIDQLDKVLKSKKQNAAEWERLHHEREKLEGDVKKMAQSMKEEENKAEGEERKSEGEAKKAEGEERKAETEKEEKSFLGKPRSTVVKIRIPTPQQPNEIEKEKILEYQIETGCILSALIAGHAQASNNEDYNNQEERCKQEKQDSIASTVIEIKQKKAKRRLNYDDLKKIVREEQMKEHEVYPETERRPRRNRKPHWDPDYLPDSIFDSEDNC